MVKRSFILFLIVSIGLGMPAVFANPVPPVPSKSLKADTKTKQEPIIQKNDAKQTQEQIIKTTDLMSDPKDKPVESLDKTNVAGITFNIQDNDKQEIKISDPKKLDGQLFESDQEKMEHTFQIQKKMDVDDIKLLWESTVERNVVIRFALKKLASPADQRRIHSSLMAKSVSALISGVAILPSLFGVDTFASTASLAGGSLANRVIQNKTMPKNMPLTDTELIQLAKLINELQDGIIKNYYDYKSAIESLRVCRQNLLIQNKNYSDAIKSGNSIAIIAASALYDKELVNEVRLKQQIKLARMELERLAGPETISKLALTKMAVVDVDTTKVEEQIKSATSMEVKK